MKIRELYKNPLRVGKQAAKQSGLYLISEKISKLENIYRGNDNNFAVLLTKALEFM